MDIQHTAIFLQESMINIDGVWGVDVEIMAASAILQVDIFVANSEYQRDSQEKFHQVVSWKLMRANMLNKEAIFIKNFDLHFEPVTSQNKQSYTNLWSRGRSD